MQPMNITWDEASDPFYFFLFLHRKKEQHEKETEKKKVDITWSFCLLKMTINLSSWTFAILNRMAVPKLVCIEHSF